MIEYTIKDKIAFVEIKVDKYNILTQCEIDLLLVMMDKFKNDKQITGVIITGNGKAFCTGINIEKLIEEKERDQISYLIKQNDKLLFELFKFNKPFVSLIDGHSIGEGLLLQLCSDYIIIHNQHKIKMGFPELNIGLTLSPIMFDILGNYITKKQIATLIQGGKFFNLEEAKVLNFIDEVSEKELMYDKAHAKIIELLRSGNEAFSLAKNSIRSTVVEKMGKHILEQNEMNYLLKTALSIIDR